VHVVTFNEKNITIRANDIITLIATKTCKLTTKKETYSKHLGAVFYLATFCVENCWLAVVQSLEFNERHTRTVQKQNYTAVDTIESVVEGEHPSAVASWRKIVRCSISFYVTDWAFIIQSDQITFRAIKFMFSLITNRSPSD